MSQGQTEPPAGNLQLGQMLERQKAALEESVRRQLEAEVDRLTGERSLCQELAARKEGKYESLVTELRDKL